MTETLCLSGMVTIIIKMKYPKASMDKEIIQNEPKTVLLNMRITKHFYHVVHVLFEKKNMWFSIPFNI